MTTSTEPVQKQTVAPGDKKRSFPNVLAQLGLIATPPGMIALFCQVMNVSPQGTAAWCLAVMAGTSICMYRRFINRRIPSSLLLGVMVAASALFFFNYQHLLLKDTGLIQYFKKSNAFLPEIDREIQGSRDEIWFVGMNFNISAGEQRDLLLKKLGEGVKIRYLIFNPRSARLGDVAPEFDQTAAELKSESEKGLQSILELQRQWQSRSQKAADPGELEIRVFEAIPHARFYVFDPGRTSGKTYFVPYVNRVDSPALPGYLLENSATGVFSEYFGGIRKLWQHSKRLEDVLPNAPQPLTTGRR